MHAACIYPPGISRPTSKYRSKDHIEARLIPVSFFRSASDLAVSKRIVRPQVIFSSPQIVENFLFRDCQGYVIGLRCLSGADLATYASNITLVTWLLGTAIGSSHVHVIEREDGRSYALMHAERRPSSGTGQKHYDNYCFRVRRIIIFIYHGQVPHSQISRAEHAFLCSIKVVNKETASLSTGTGFNKMSHCW